MMRSTKVLGALSLALLLTATGYVTAEETKGTVKAVDTTKNEVVLKGIIKDSTYELNKDAFVCLDGVKAALKDIKEGDKACIVYEKRGDHMMASEVRGLRNAQETTGTVRGVFAEKHEVTLKGIVKDTTYELNKDATVWLNGKAGTLTDLKEGDHVMVVYQVKGDHNMAAHVRATRK